MFRVPTVLLENTRSTCTLNKQKKMALTGKQEGLNVLNFLAPSTLFKTIKWNFGNYPVVSQN